MQSINKPQPDSKRRSLSQNKYALYAIVGTVLLLVLVAARQLDARSMHTYTSSDGGFRFRYPVGFTLHVNEVSVAGSVVYHPVQNVIELDAPGHPRPYILIEYMYNVGAQQIDEFVENSSECDEIAGHPGQSVVVDSMPARIFRDISCNSDGETRVYIVNGTTGYNIILHGKPADERLLTMVLANFWRIRTTAP
jgi:hypothetical protein